jgi:Zn-finger nucleic acid-binding protein
VQHGLWFDRGELNAVIVAAGAGPGNVLASFMADLEKQRAGSGQS